MPARIYQPAKTAMQSGKSKTNRWVLEFEADQARKIDPLMGYTSSSDMNSQVKLEFSSLEAALLSSDKPVKLIILDLTHLVPYEKKGSK